MKPEEFENQITEVIEELQDCLTDLHMQLRGDTVIVGYLERVLRAKFWLNETVEKVVNEKIDKDGSVK